MGIYHIRINRITTSIKKKEFKKSPACDSLIGRIQITVSRLRKRKLFKVLSDTKRATICVHKFILFTLLWILSKYSWSWWYNSKYICVSHCHLKLLSHTNICIFYTSVIGDETEARCKNLEYSIKPVPQDDNYLFHFFA